MMAAGDIVKSVEDLMKDFGFEAHPFKVSRNRKSVGYVTMYNCNCSFVSATAVNDLRFNTFQSYTTLNWPEDVKLVILNWS